MRRPRSFFDADMVKKSEKTEMPGRISDDGESIFLPLTNKFKNEKADRYGMRLFYFCINLAIESCARRNNYSGNVFY